MWYTEKIIISGDVIEHIKYEYPQRFGDQRPENTGRSEIASDEQKEINRGKVLERDRKEIRNSVNANVSQYKDDTGRIITPKFFTRTFALNITDMDYANEENEKFMRKLKNLTGYELKYKTVVEFQDRGAIHYHTIFFNLPYTHWKKIKKLWEHGTIKINKINDVGNVGAYFCKYLTKANSDDRLKGRKCYFSSRGLFKPKIEIEKSRVKLLVDSLPSSSKTYKSTYHNDYTGKIEYAQYNIGTYKYVYVKDDEMRITLPDSIECCNS